MRVRFRISFYRGDKRLKRSDFGDTKDPLWVGMRYIVEFKYLEANKWLLIAPDSYEKYILLTLTNLAIGQEEQAREFLYSVEGADRKTDVRVVVELPEEGVSLSVNAPGDLIGLFEKVS